MTDKQQQQVSEEEWERRRRSMPRKPQAETVKESQLSRKAMADQLDKHYQRELKTSHGDALKFQKSLNRAEQTLKRRQEGTR